MVDAPRDALELFGSTPVDALVLGGHLVRRAALTAQGSRRDGRGRQLGYDGDTVVIPTVGRPTLTELLLGLARQEGLAAAEVIVVDDRPEPAPAIEVPTSSPAGSRCASCWAWAGPGGGPQPRGAPRPDPVDRVPRRRRGRAGGWALAPSTISRPRPTGSRACRAGSACPGPKGDDRPTGSARRLVWSGRSGPRPTWPIGPRRCGRGRRLRRALPAGLPRGRRPGPSRSRGRLAARRGGAVRPAPGAAGGSVGERPRAARQHRRRADAPPAWGGLAPVARGPVEVGCPGTGDDAGRSGRAGRPGHCAARRVGALGAAAWLGLHRGLHAAPGRTRTEDAARGRHDGVDERRHPGRSPWPTASPVGGGTATPSRGLLPSRRCSSTGTARSSRTCPTTATRSRPADADARHAVDRLRIKGIRVGVITNQSGVARGLISTDEVRAVNERIDRAIGPFDAWEVCHHGPDDGCECRKPRPGLVARRRGGSACGRPDEVRRHRRHRRGRAGGARGGARAVLVPTP